MGEAVELDVLETVVPGMVDVLEPVVPGMVDVEVG